MKRMIFALMLAIVSGAWTMSEAQCFSRRPDSATGVSFEGTGELVMTGDPCWTGKPCTDCITEAIKIGGQLYYLSPVNKEIEQAIMDIALRQLSQSNPSNVTVRGEHRIDGNFLTAEIFHFIDVSYIKDDNPIPSLCDEWNVLEVSGVTCGGCEVYRTVNYYLTTDTLINNTRYLRLMKDNNYEGALCERGNRNIYYIPAGSEHEYLLYAFNAKEGRQLTNLWLGGQPEWCPKGYYAKVISVSEETPRLFTLQVEYLIEDGVIDTLIVEWTEGIGLGEGPVGAPRCIGCADSRAFSVLCAYKDGEQVYASDLSKKIGCEYNYDPNGTSADTIPLYVKDGPGTSTVDPIDPNLIVALLQTDLLVIKEFTGMEIGLILSNGSPNQAPARGRTPQQQQSFRNEVSIPLTEPGIYTIELTCAEWDYAITGTFSYMPQGIETVSGQETTAPVKTLQNGQLFIIRSGKTFTLTGQEMK